MLVLSCGDGAVEPAPPPAPVATTVTVNPASAAMSALGETTRFTAEVRDQNGQVMAGAAVAWASSDASIAAVDASGVATATANGSATITATSGAASGTAAVTVEQVVNAVAVSPAADTLVAFGDTVRLFAEATDANGHAVAAITEFVWSSSDTLVARVDASGLVESLAEGEATVSATASELTGHAELTVVAPLPTTIAVSPDAVRFTALGQTTQLEAEVREQAGRVMAQVTVSWSSGDTLVVVVDSAGLVTAVGAGTTTVTVAAGEVAGAVVVTVMQSAGSVLVSPSESTIGVGDTLRLAAEAFDENGHRVDGAAFAWSSSDAGIARVDQAGLVEAIAEGTARIRATAGDVSGTAQVTVENPDRAALVALYEATDGPNWVDNTNWLSDAPLGEWHGVRTDSLGRVVYVDLQGHGLNGPIPPELGTLGNLQGLRLRNNSLSGPVPPQLGNLGNLRVLDLQSNDLWGPIPPELGNLGNLRLLHLSANNLSGPIPSELGNLAALGALYLDGNSLTGPMPPALDGLRNLRELYLSHNTLTGPIPPELGSLRNLTRLYLHSNTLTGPIPPELGNLGNLRRLRLYSNALAGPIPETFLQLDGLQVLRIRANEGLCVPGTPTFFSWLRAIEDRDDESETLCNATDVAALRLLYESTDGTAWNESAGWSDDGAVADWHGVTADSLGRVTILDLSHNGLAGRLPSSVANLAHLTELRIPGNTRLSGRLPLSLAHLSLRALHYSGTGLCAPVDASFGDWLSAIPSHEGTGTECAPLSDREILETLYHATDGPNWTDNENWLTDAPVGQWHGVLTNALTGQRGRVAILSLPFNGLTGSIPPELGSLTKLQRLSPVLQPGATPTWRQLPHRSDPAGTRQPRQPGATPTWRQLPYRPDPAGTRQPHRPDQPVSLRQPTHRQHPGRIGPARRSRIDGCLGERTEWFHPACIRRPGRFGVTVARRERSFRSDPARTRQPRQPAVAIPQ